LNIHRDESRILFFGQLYPLLRGLSLNGLIPLGLKQVTDELAVLLVVLNDQE
jgi:hypothetical protein